MKNQHNAVHEDLYAAIARAKNAEECRLIFEDLCTSKEIEVISQRLMVAKLIKDGKNYAQINNETGVSTTIISRIRRAMENSGGGYDLLMDN